MCGGGAPPKFHADHPFMFILKSTNVVLFMGRVVRPDPVPPGQDERWKAAFDNYNKQRFQS